MDLQKLRWYQLKKQQLLFLSTDYLTVLHENLVLHATDPLTPFFSLWARTQNFEPQNLFDDLNQTRQAVRVRAFRGTLFVATITRLPEILAASKIYFEAQLSQIQKAAEKHKLDLGAQTERLYHLLAGNKSLTSREIKTKIQNPIPEEWFIMLMRFWEFNRDLGRASLRYLLDNSIQYSLMHELLPEISSQNSEPWPAVESIFLNYLRHFGPVSLEDICWWFPLKKTAARQMLDRLSSHWVEVKRNQVTCYMEKNDFLNYSEFKFDEPATPVVHFLPYEDHFPKAYLLRDWFLNDSVREIVYEKGTINLGQIRPTVWVNGEIVGRWEIAWNGPKKTIARVELKGMQNTAAFSDGIEAVRRRLEDFINSCLIPLIKK